MAAARRTVQSIELSPNQVGKIFGVTGEAVKTWISAKKLQARKHTNGYWKITKTDIEAFLKERQTVARSKILLVATDTVTQGIINAACNGSNLDLLACDNIDEAIEKAGDYNVALLVVDCTCDETWNALNRIRIRRGMNKQIQHIPILLVTGNSLSDRQLNHALSRGIKGVLVKPISREQIAAEIKFILEPRFNPNAL